VRAYHPFVCVITYRRVYTRCVKGVADYIRVAARSRSTLEYLIYICI